MSNHHCKSLYKLRNSIKKKKSVLITGSAGTGKTTLLKSFIKKCEKEMNIIVSASTGIAALHINGSTIHTLLKLNSGTIEQIVERIKMDTTRYQMWLECKVLIIDEISFIDQVIFEKISSILTKLKNVNDPFGGIQLVLCGDFAQLPPVNTRNDDVEFCFYSDLFEQLNLEIIHLKKSMRQQNDLAFFNILEKIRFGQLDDVVHETLQKRLVDDNNLPNLSKSIYIYGKNEDVDRHNEIMLQTLPNEKQNMTMSIKFDPNKINQLTQEDIINLVRSLPCQMVLKLCVGARVYLCTNLNVGKGLVNGLSGIVKGFKIVEDKIFPIVKFDGLDDEIIVKRFIWRRYYKQIHLSFSQVPLALGWSFTVHKSQGMTIENNIVLSLDKKNIFETQQAYVALSRATSLDQIYLKSYDPSVLKIHPNVQHYYNQIDKIK